MTKKILITVGFLGLVAILLFVLERVVFFSPLINYFNFNTAISLHFFHTVVLLTFAFKNKYIRETKINILYTAFVAGIVLACTPLYLMHYIDPVGSTKGILTIISFIGSGSLIGGWIMVTYIGFSYNSKFREKKQ
jgi:uncharacterized membrane protein YgdD (TMEM256/DUF423 family)